MISVPVDFKSPYRDVACCRVRVSKLESKRQSLLPDKRFVLCIPSCMIYKLDDGVGIAFKDGVGGDIDRLVNPISVRAFQMNRRVVWICRHKIQSLIDFHLVAGSVAIIVTAAIA